MLTHASSSSTMMLYVVMALVWFVVHVSGLADFVQVEIMYKNSGKVLGEGLVVYPSKQKGFPVYNWDILGTNPTAFGALADSGVVRFNCSFSRHVDAVSVLIQQALFNQALLVVRATIYRTDAALGSQTIFLRYTLDYAIISGYEVSSSSSDEENVWIQAGLLKWEVLSGGSVVSSAGYDMTRNTAMTF